MFGSQQGKGLGKKMIAYVEQKLKTEEVRILIIETSGLPDFEELENFMKAVVILKKRRSEIFMKEETTKWYTGRNCNSHK